MSEPTNGNTKQNGGGELVDTLILTYNRATDRLDIGGNTSSLDLSLDMLGRARRAIEFQMRKAQALDIQAAARQQAADEAIAAALRKTR